MLTLTNQSIERALSTGHQKQDKEAAEKTAFDYGEEMSLDRKDAKIVIVEIHCW